MEEQPTGPGAPTVEAEGEFIEIVVEMSPLNASLMSADQPSLEQRGNKMDARHDFMSRVRTATDHGDLMLVARLRKPGIAFPSVGSARVPRKLPMLHARTCS